MKDLWDSVRQQVSDRMGSPIFGSFVIAWLCWNHQYLVIIFSDLPVEYRLKLASELLYLNPPWGLPRPFGFLLRGVLWPALASLGYIFIYPHASKLLLGYWDRRQTEISNLRKEAQKKELLTREEADRVIQSRIDERGRFTKQIDLLQQEIEVLRNSTNGTAVQDELNRSRERISELEKERAMQEARNSEMAEAISKKNRKAQDFTDLHPILRILALKGRMQTKAVQEHLKLSQLRFDVLARRALESGLVDESRSFENSFYSLLPAGQRYVVEHNLDADDGKIDGGNF